MGGWGGAGTYRNFDLFLPPPLYIGNDQVLRYYLLR